MVAAGLTRSDVPATAAIAAVAAAAAAASLILVPGPRGVLGAALAVVMLTIAAIDARHFIIPDVLSAAAFALALINAALDPWNTSLSAVGMALLRAVVLAACFFALRAIYFRLRSREGIGLGDVKLAGVAGAWLDWTSIPIAIEIAALVALAAYLVRQFAGGRQLDALARLPFGLFLAPAIWLAWLIQAVWLAA